MDRTRRHRPSEAAQTDFTHATDLAVTITIAGRPFVHRAAVLELAGGDETVDLRDAARSPL
jgi:hypothetical protein